MRTVSLFVFISASLSACGDSKYQSATPNNKAKGAANANAGTEDVSGQLKETFAVESSSGKTDIVWVVDQSGSMSTETQNVQNNLSNFFNSLNQKVDARYALIASSSSSNKISLPAASDKQLQIEQSVASTNALEIAISTFTRADVPEQPLIDPNNPAAGRITKYPTQGALSNFFRSDALPVVVVVTDDNARKVTEQNFLQLAKAAIGKEPKVYAWRGNKSLPEIPNAQCNVARDGIAYEKLAEATGGEVFNLCEPDWSATFSKLTTNIIAAVKNSFTVQKEIKSVVSVTIDGRKLDANKITTAGRTITLPQDELSKSPNGKVTITYVPK
ncbi:MAG: hypothetical protein RLZZ488_303 [Pseudomonadota bacterium]|jgi:hypothetical protein